MKILHNINTYSQAGGQDFFKCFYKANFLHAKKQLSQNTISNKNFKNFSYLTRSHIATQPRLVLVDGQIINDAEKISQNFFLI